MKRKALVQEYFILATNDKGYMSAMYKDEAEAGLIAAAFMDLSLNHLITVEKKKIIAAGELPEELECIRSFYAYLKEKPRSMDKVTEDYVLCTQSRVRRLMEDIGESLVAEGLAAREKGGIFGPKTIYIPEKMCRAYLAEGVKAAMEAEGELTAHDVTLLYLLKATKNLKNYCSKDEMDVWKSRWKEMKKKPENKQLSDMIDYVNDRIMMIGLFVTVAMT